MFGAVTVDIERSALGELGVDVADEALVETLAAAVLARDNTALLKGLSCYAVDGLGNRYERPSVTYGGGETIQLESCYFSDSRDLTLCITGASWLDKDKTSFTLDLSTGKADWLPEGMVIESVERSGNNVYWALQPGDGVSLHWSYYCLLYTSPSPRDRG